MPVQASQWTEFLSCPICYNEFDENVHKPISLGCGHTVCKTCLNKLHRKACPFDQTAINTDIDVLPVNFALLQLVGAQVPDQQTVNLSNLTENKHYEVAKKCVEELALYLKPLSGGKGVASLNQSALSRPMQRKLVTLVNCQLVEEEGRVRAMRAARSLGERTVTELILQHQNPQQLSANLWAAVRARGCQFLGPAMQEEALKLVLLALEDGSALSRKVLVLFVVQRLEPRFPQASKTSIGHVVQLLYRASCFKVTKRDEDSSLMQLKEEFRTYEALRREHDAQIVHIAMEAGLRISPEQWSSLLYGDLAHKSHMQSIIDKLQSPESFAKSVQELTIVLQRTTDPANLNRLRSHLELLANIDPNPDAAPPTWEQLENAMVAVRTVVHGLVDFIQNFSKKGHETPQPQPNSKYKTSMCRDLRQQGGCPRGANCTFAHSQEELEKYRMRNKKINATVRPFPLSQALQNKVGITNIITTSAGNVVSMTGSTETTVKMVQTPNGIISPESTPQLIPRCADTSAALETAKKIGQNCLSTSGSLSGSPPEKLYIYFYSKVGSPPKTILNQVLATPAVVSSHIGSDATSLPSSKSVSRVSVYPSQQPDLYYPDPRTPVSYELTAYHQPGGYYPPHPGLPSGVSPCLPRYVRPNSMPESPLPPTVPYTDHYNAYPSRDRLASSPYPSATPQQYGSVPAVHSGMYAPVYDSRRMWRPQMYPRDDVVRSNSLPPMEMVPSAAYHPPPRERYSSLDGYYSMAGQPANEQRSVSMQKDVYSRMQQPGFDDLLRRKPDQWTHCSTQKPPLVSSALSTVTQPSDPPSPLFSVDFNSEFSENTSDLCVGTKFDDDSISHYSPWSCGTISSCISAMESDPKDIMATTSVEVMDLNVKRRLNLFDSQRRAKDEDPIIPFGDGPIISKWGAISRSARTGYHNTDPVQATASQGSATKPISITDYSPHVSHADSSNWNSHVLSYGSNSTTGQYLNRDRLRIIDLPGHRKLSNGGDQLNVEMQQREFSEVSADARPDRDIELELSALDTDADQDEGLEDVLDLGIGSQSDRTNDIMSENGHHHKHQGQEQEEQGRRIAEQIAITEEQKMIPITSGFNQPTTASVGYVTSPPMTASFSISNLVLKTSAVKLSEDNDVKPATNGETLVNGS
ncbi:roquin-2 isoform X5 [Stegostoma tigrinum]|uniref:roquin-2 isoform X5 n=1 Tax=Stegostoma tigrinum TaxID=3053191 RepID=UPI00202B00D9|nr:roquin-2 isoform X5 [Stegostoma tigrinum]